MADDSSETQTDAALEELFVRSERVPFVYWRAYTGPRTTVLLAGAVAVLAFVTALSHLSRDRTFGGPLAFALPPGWGEFVPFGTVLLAFVLGGFAMGLRRRLTIAWYGTVLALSLAVVVPFVTARPTDVLLFVGALAALPLAIRNRAAFDRSLDLSAFQTAAIVAFVAAQIYGTVGAYTLRETGYDGIETWIDALYYVVVTGTTVGYGDATPTSQGAKLFTLSVIVFGTGTFAVASGSLIVPALESRLGAAFGTMTTSELSLLDDHVLVLGYGDLTEPLLDELVSTTDVVVVTPDEDTTSALDDRDITVLSADPTADEALLDAGIERASGVVAATNDDARDTLAVLAARGINSTVRIVAAATDHRHVDKLERVGADEVISPSTIVGRRLGRSLLDTDGTEADESGTPAETDETTEDVSKAGSDDEDAAS